MYGHPKKYDPTEDYKRRASCPECRQDKGRHSQFCKQGKTERNPS